VMSEMLCTHTCHDVCTIFFFSSRRRHTILVSDWSSDVCSSDLCSMNQVRGSHNERREPLTWFIEQQNFGIADEGTGDGEHLLLQIGRASCRERVEISGGAV